MSDRRIRIALVDVRGLLLGIVKGATTQSDMEIVLESGGMSGLPALAAAEPDVIILGQDEPSLAAGLLEALPNVKVLAVALNGREAVLYELRPQRVELGEISPQKLVSVIRDARQAVGARAAASRIGRQPT
jgi:hypothetical protein